MTKNAICILLVSILWSCASKKNIIYYQDIEETQFQDLSEIKVEVKIQLNDILQVDIKTTNAESTIPFMKQNVGVGGANAGGQQPALIKLQGYIVDEYGEIEMPIIGRVQVNGLTRQQAEKKIKTKLNEYLKDPYVSVRFLNFKFTVQGEVNQPGTYEVFEPNLTLLQAIGLAGDLNIRGRRDNILIIRTEGENRIVKRIDLTKTDWMNSSFYFIKQNDYIYIEPNNPQVKTSGFIGNVGVLTSVASILLSAIVIITR